MIITETIYKDGIQVVETTKVGGKELWHRVCEAWERIQPYHNYKWFVVLESDSGDWTRIE